MLKEALQYLIGLAEIDTQEEGSRTYSARELKPVIPPLPSAVEFHTLDGFVDFSKAFAKENVIVHVRDHDRVALIADETDEWEQRIVFATSKPHDGLSKFPFGQFQNPEQFVINLQSLFVDDESRAKVLEVVGNMTAEQAVSTQDDGVTQTVGQRAGVVLKSKTTVPNPVVLKPYRTFLEIEQPSSPFILRVRQSRDGTMPECALFEADGGKWRYEAAKRIQAYLQNALAEFKVMV